MYPILFRYGEGEGEGGPSLGKRLDNFIKDVVAEFPEELHGALSDGAYSFSEMGKLGTEIDINEIEPLLRIWALVETIRRKKEFPRDLRI